MFGIKYKAHNNRSITVKNLQLTHKLTN